MGVKPLTPDNGLDVNKERGGQDPGRKALHELARQNEPSSDEFRAVLKWSGWERIQFRSAWQVFPQLE